MTVVDLYTIQIIRYADQPFAEIEAERNVPVIMAETEENLTDLLPHGYRAKIRRWDDFTDEPTQEDDHD